MRVIATADLARSIYDYISREDLGDGHFFENDYRHLRVSSVIDEEIVSHMSIEEGEQQ